MKFRVNIKLKKCLYTLYSKFSKYLSICKGPPPKQGSSLLQKIITKKPQVVFFLYARYLYIVLSASQENWSELQPATHFSEN